MKFLSSITIVLLFALICTTNAQQVKLGFKFETNLLQWSGNSDRYNDFKVSELQLNCAYFTSQRFAIEARVGADGLNERYSGIDYGVLGKYLLMDNIFFTGGVIMHRDLTDQRTFPEVETFIFPSVGFEFNPFGISCEALFLYDANQYSTPESKLVGVIKLGIGYSFNL